MAEKYTSDELAQWLIEKAQNASSAGARKLIAANDQRGRDTAMVGRLYFFKYDPKWKTKLVKYDKFPMVFPIERYGNGFLGLNLHYLGASERQVLVNRLLEYSNNKYMDERTMLRLSYDLIESTKKLSSLSRPCIHRYLFNNCRSQFIEIYPNEYDKAIQLPVEDWVFKR
jgi:hypothetical protein